MLNEGGGWDRPSRILTPIKAVIDAIKAVSDNIQAVLDGAREHVTHAFAVINSDHMYVHQGIAFKSFIRLDDFGAVTKITYVIKTPADKDLHFKSLKMQSKGGSVLTTVKRATAANPIVFTGTAESPDVGTATIPELTGPNNLNDANGSAAETIITKTPTFDTSQDGENWFFIQVLGDATNQFTSVDNSSENVNEELIMDNDKYYIIDLEELDGTPTNIMLTIFWYEEPSMNN